MSLVVFLIFIFVWYFPIWRRQGQTGRLPRRTIAESIAAGLIPGFLAIIILQILFGFLLRALPLTGAAYSAVDAYISAALIEESVKFLAAYLIIRKVQPTRKVDYVLIFGAVGLGYEVTETLLLLDSVVSGFFRGVFAQHIIWQLWMGMFFWEYMQAKRDQNPAGCRRNLFLSLAVPFFLHGTNDFLAFMVEKGLKNVEPGALENFSAQQVVTPDLEAAGWWFLALLVFMILQIIFQIVTFRMALKTAADSRKMDAVQPDREKNE